MTVYDENDPIDPWGFERDRLDRERSERRDQGFGVLAVPFVLPLLMPVIAVLYPLAGAALGATMLAAPSLGPAVGIPPDYQNTAVYIASFIVVWIFGRFDVRLGERRAYWLFRHLYRTLVLTCAIIYIATSNAFHDGTISGIIGALFDVPLRLIIAILLIALTQYTLIGEGATKTFWHGTLNFLRMRPEELGL